MLRISRLSMARAACTSSSRACAFDFSPPDRLKALSHDFTSINTALDSRIIDAFFCKIHLQQTTNVLIQTATDHISSSYSRTVPPSALRATCSFFFAIEIRTPTNFSRISFLSPSCTNCCCSFPACDVSDHTELLGFEIQFPWQLFFHCFPSVFRDDSGQPEYFGIAA